MIFCMYIYFFLLQTTNIAVFSFGITYNDTWIHGCWWWWWWWGGKGGGEEKLSTIKLPQTNIAPNDGLCSEQLPSIFVMVIGHLLSS